MAHKVKHIIFIMILAALLLPALQHLFQLFPEKPLDGDFDEKQLPKLSRESWLAGEYQSAFDPWMEEHIGFHNGLVRVNNQLDYSLFHRTKAEGVIRGLNGQLFEYDYIRAWTGKDFVGAKLLDTKLRQFRFLQQQLKDLYDIDLILILEPGKASLYEEDIPGEFTRAEKGKSNYEFIRDRSIELGIQLIDLNAWYLQIKDTSTYPLFPQQGTHWSEFAMWYAADSLLNYIENIRGIELPGVIQDGREYSKELRSTDYDVGVTMNLLFELDHGEMPYPEFHFEEDAGNQKPNVLAIADSYYWNIFNTRIPENLFNNQAFWYFYKKVYPDSYYGEKLVKDLNIREEIEKQDVILFMATERFLYMIDRGFVDDLISIYGVKNSLDELTRYKTGILNDGIWFAELIDRAEQKGISLGEMIDRHARFLFETANPDEYYSIYGPDAIIKNILRNEEWLQNIEESAEERNISVEERMMDEALYILKTEHPAALEKYQLIQQYMSNIRTDSIWHAQTLEKASRYFMTEEEMVRAEAEFVYQIEYRTETE